MSDKAIKPNIDINSRDWKEVQHVLNTFASAYEVWAFGSRVTKSAKPYSDLDLVVITKNPMSFSEQAALVDSFEESALPFKVDVVDWAATNDSFKKIILKNKVVVKKRS